MNRFERILFGIACVIFAVCGACSSSTEPVIDPHGCDFVKEAIWQAAGNKLPVPDTLMRSNAWDLPAPWYLGLETTFFTPIASRPGDHGCTVVNI
jgi:hypothetical protein